MWCTGCGLQIHISFTPGLDYLWDCILQVPDDIVHKPIELLKDIFTNLSSKLPQEQVIHVHVLVYTHMHVYTCTYMYMCTCTSICTFTYTYACTHVYVYVST